MVVERVAVVYGGMTSWCHLDVIKKFRRQCSVQAVQHPWLHYIGSQELGFNSSVCTPYSVRSMPFREVPFLISHFRFVLG